MQLLKKAVHIHFMQSGHMLKKFKQQLMILIILTLQSIQIHVKGRLKLQKLLMLNYQAYIKKLLLNMQRYQKMQEKYIIMLMLQLKQLMQLVLQNIQIHVRLISMVQRHYIMHQKLKNLQFYLQQRQKHQKMQIKLMMQWMQLIQLEQQ